MKIKSKIQTFQRPNGDNEFKSYLNNLDEKERTKFITILRTIEYKGQLVARKNRWLSNVRDTGLIEFRSNIGHNQQRGIGYYDHQTGNYILLTGFTKKDKRFNTQTIEYAQTLKALALAHPNFVDYDTKSGIKQSHHPIKARKVQYVKSTQPTTKVDPFANKPVSQRKAKKHISIPQAPTKLHKEPITMSKSNTNNNTNEQRLQRMFDDIKQLSPNQILILNDLINSWK